MKLTSLLKEIKVVKPDIPEKGTILWWLYKLPEPYRTQAINNHKNQPDYEEIKNSKVNHIYYALKDAFLWRASAEGYNYWWGLYHKLKNNEPLTEIKVVNPSPPKKHTPEWWFHKLPEPYRTQALTNFKKDEYYEYYKDDKYDSLYNALMDLEWDKTPEGFDYWEIVFNKIIYHEPLNEIKVINPSAPEPNKILWWLYQLPEPTRTQAITNYKNETNKEHIIYRNYKYNSMFEAIDYAFNWINTPEGEEYWEEIYSGFVQNF